MLAIMLPSLMTSYKVLISLYVEVRQDTHRTRGKGEIESFVGLEWNKEAGDSDA